jgi:hypothetical protein
MLWFSFFRVNVPLPYLFVRMLFLQFLILCSFILSRVVDPDSFNTVPDPDPAFLLNLDPDPS